MNLQPQVFESACADDIAPTTASTASRAHLPQVSAIIVSVALSVSGTSSAELAYPWEAPYVFESEATSSGLSGQCRSSTDDAEATRRAISELRRISGLTWEQLGELFDVSRRSVHFWASGKPLNVGNEQRLMQILDVVRAADRGDARATRASLFEAKDGVTAFALLTAQRFEQARAMLACGAGRPAPALAQLSAAAKAAREPLPPEDLVDAQQDRVHRDLGRGRIARTVRNQRRGTS
ncbi:MAG: XRE family transcriptional regulator [Gammaproteobacteria bacterium]|nr:MAG: XRE family transcriptional regulator [Gammaproteobacteria bacterium]